MSDTEARLNELLDEFEELIVFEEDYGGREYQLEPAPDAEYRQAWEAFVGGDLPPDLAAFLKRTRGIRGVGGDLVLPEQPPQGRLSRYGPLGELLKVGGEWPFRAWFLEPLQDRCRIWWMAEYHWSIGLYGRTLADFFENRLDWVRRHKEATDPLIEIYEEEAFDREPVLPPPPGHPPADHHTLDAVIANELDGSDDSVLQKALDDIPPNSHIFDFRAGETPLGFDWYRYVETGPRWRRIGPVLAANPEQDIDKRMKEQQRRRRERFLQKRREMERFENLEFEVESPNGGSDPWWRFW